MTVDRLHDCINNDDVDDVGGGYIHHRHISWMRCENTWILKKKLMRVNSHDYREVLVAEY